VNKESFIQVLRNPRSISTDQLAQVEEVVEQFPYFQVARSVIACGTKSLKREDAPSKLAKAAIYTTNRQLLKKYVNGQFDFDLADNIQVGIHRETQQKVVAEEDTTSKKRPKFRIIERRSKSDGASEDSGKFKDVTKKVEDDGIEEELTVIEADGSVKTTITHGLKEIKKETESDTASKQETTEKQEAVTPDTTEIKDTAEEVTTEKEAEVVEEEVQGQQDLDKVISEIKEEEIEHRKEILEKQEEPPLTAGELVDDVFKNLEAYKQSRDHYLEVEEKILHKQESDAIDEAILKANTKLSAPTKEEKPDVITPEQEDKPTPTSTESKEETKSEEKKPVAKSKSVPAKKANIPKPKAAPETQEEKKPATPKLKTLKKEKKESEETETASNEAEIAQEVDNDIISEAKVEALSTSASDKDKKEIQKEIIERFIKNNPKILPSDEEPKGEISDLSSSSSEMKDDLVTENLAIILARQGKRDKAIEIYEKLILKIPKKKSYFAARIAELK